MSSWHYQLMRHTDPLSDDVYYAVHEYYDLETGPAWTLSPVTVDGESVDDVRKMLVCILKDMDTHGVKDYDTDESNTD
jgi:hypothetical protein